VGAIGAFTFVLHSHLPYVRLAGRWPHGEEWIHEAASETYIPLLNTLYDLKEEGVNFRLTLGITPVLAEQLADTDVLHHFDQYVEDRISAASSDMAYFEQQKTTDLHLRWLAEWYRNWYTHVKKSFHERFNGDIIGAYRRLQDEGYIELITSAATHSYLPLLGSDSSIQAQMKTGIASHTRLFGKAPAGFWLPECAYRPAYIRSSGAKRPGLETFLAQNGIKVFFADSHLITGGQPVGVADGDAIGPYGFIKRRYVIPAGTIAPPREATTFQAYYVSETIKGMGSSGHSGVTVIGRNDHTGQQVWSSEGGYPGDFDYREFYKRAGTSGLQYWRVTGANIDLAAKDYYHPDWAAYKIEQHAEHFAHLVGDLLRDYHRKTGNFGLLASNYDAELFGHWWFEGVRWLGMVLRHLSVGGEIEITTASQYIENNPPTGVLNLPEGSWGAGGTHFTWDNGETHWMWPAIHEAEARMESLVAQFPEAAGDAEVVLKQAARELLLLQSSDWPFLITTGQAREYAIQRFNQHLERFDKLATSLESSKPNRALADEYWQLDKVFADIDYRWFHAVNTKG
jgi:1,4-alpha-glucan branching enzyme